MKLVSILSVVLEPLVADWGTTITLVPVIDHLLLTRRVGVFERNERLRPAGAYAGLSYHDSLFGPLDEYLMWNLTDGSPQP
jgi:hypothetical protein